MIWLDKLVVPSLSLIEQCLVMVLVFVTMLVIYQTKQRLFQQSPVKFVWVTVANLVSFIAVLLLVLPIQIKQMDNNQVILLTSGFEQTSFNAQTLCDHSSNIYYLNKSTDNSALNLAQSCDDSLTRISHLSELKIFEPNIDHLVVYGDGLTEQHWQLLQLNTHQYFPSEPMSGFISPLWLKEAVLGESITFSAKLQVSQSQQRKSEIHLIQFIDVNGEVLAEQNVRHQEAFSFVFTPKTSGKHSYRVRLIENTAEKGQDNKIVVDEVIPVNITLASVPRVLIVQSAPNYESKYFKHWLTENNGQLLTVTQISKDHVISESVNLPENTPAVIKTLAQQNSLLTSLNEVITPDILQYFDLLMIDSKALLSLDSRQLKVLDNVNNNGLGVLIAADERLITAYVEQKLPILAIFQSQANQEKINKSNEAKQKQVFLHWLNNRFEHITKQPITAEQINLQNFKAKTLVYDQQKQPLVISNIKGKGKIALTSINRSFQLKTNGLVHEYSQFWQFITSSLARNSTRLSWIPQPDNKLSFEGQPLTACFLAESNVMQSANISQIIKDKEIPLYINVEGQNKYCSIYFSNEAGWQSLRITSELSEQMLLDNRQLVYHFSQQDWLAWQQALKHFATEKNVKQSQTLSKLDNESLTEVNKLIIFFGLLLSSILLWIERKLF